MVAQRKKKKSDKKTSKSSESLNVSPYFKKLDEQALELINKAGLPEFPKTK